MASLGIFRYPAHIKSVKAKIMYTVFFMLRIRSTGQGQIIGRFTSFLPEIAGIVIILNQLGLSLDRWQLIWFMIGSQALVMILGYLYMYHDFDRIESVVNIQRDQLQKDLHERVLKRKGDEL